MRRTGKQLPVLLFACPLDLCAVLCYNESDKLPSNRERCGRVGECMKISKIIKTGLLGWVYGINLFFALALWLCGQRGDILMGIILLVFYRLTLWFSPVAVTLICWLPLKPRASVPRTLLCNLVHLLLCGALFVTCYLLFGNWY